MTEHPSGQHPNDDKSTPVQKLVFELSKLPGIGERTATRLAYFILKQDATYARALADALVAAKQKTQFCSACLTFSDVDPCRICSSPQRSARLICVVERPADAVSIENALAFRGHYHVLHGALSPLDGIGPDDLKIRELLYRVARLRPAPGETANSDQTIEIILGTNPSVEGEATALYISRLLHQDFPPHEVRVTKLAHGIPVGGRLEFTDRLTIGKAIENRVEMTH